MIATDENAAIIDLAGAERREAMRTAILDRSDLTDRIAKQGDGFVEDGASDDLAGTDAVGPGRHVPAVTKIRHRSPLPIEF
nr:hypothetical protein [Tardibacter chloracetimidivorans]